MNQEKNTLTIEGILEKISMSLHRLDSHIIKLEQKKRSYIFKGVYSQLPEIIDTVSLFEGKKLLQNEFSRLISENFSLCSSCDFDIEETINKNLTKFNRRCDVMMELARADGYLTFDDKPMSVMKTYWNRAKGQLAHEKLNSALGFMAGTVNTIENVIAAEMRARSFGFRWTHYEQPIAKIRDECQEVLDVINNPDKKEELQDELGDLMLASFSCCLYFNFDLNDTLRQCLMVEDSSFPHDSLGI